MAPQSKSELHVTIRHLEGAGTDCLPIGVVDACRFKRMHNLDSKNRKTEGEGELCPLCR